MTEENAETELVRRCVAGEEEGWRELVARYGPAVRENASRAVGVFPGTSGSSDADEIVSMVWERLHRDDCRLLRLHRAHSLAAWLKIITWTACREYARGRRRYEDRLKRLRERLVREQGEGAQSPDADSEEVQNLRAALDSLSSRDRILLQLRYVDDLSYEEIGRSLRLSPTGVGTLIRRALDRLRRNFPHFLA